METPLLKDSLIALYEAKQNAESETKIAADKLTEKETADRFFHFFGVQPDQVIGMKAMHEGLTFVRNCGYGGDWQIEKECPECKGQTTAGGNSKEELGKILTEPPALCYTCKCQIDQKQLSGEDKLIEAFRDFISQNCHCD